MVEVSVIIDWQLPSLLESTRLAIFLHSAMLPLPDEH